nr:hypothetical protein [Actinomadura spongiicola]
MGEISSLGVQALPADEPQSLAVAFREPSQRRVDASALRQPGRDVVDRTLVVPVVAQPSPQPSAPPPSAGLVRQDVAGDVQQPRERAVGGNVLPPPPRDQERLGGDVPRGLVVDASGRVGQDVVVVRVRFDYGGNNLNVHIVYVDWIYVERRSRVR